MLLICSALGNCHFYFVLLLIGKVNWCFKGMGVSRCLPLFNGGGRHCRDICQVEMQVRLLERGVRLGITSAVGIC